MAKMTLKVKVNDLHFQYQLRVSHDACLVQILWFQLKFVTSHRVDKVKFTDRRADGQTQATTIPFGLSFNRSYINAWRLFNIRYIINVWNPPNTQLH